MFSIERKVASREELAVINNAHKIGESWELLKEPKPGTIPVGSVEYCLKVYPKPIFVTGLTSVPVIDFYPEFLRPFYRRRIYFWNLAAGNGFVRGPVFLKSALQYKSDVKARVFSDESVPAGIYWNSEIVNFVQEWRYYVAKGELITTGWYSGDNEDEPAPELDVDWPKDFSGAVDFGRLDDGRIALVESHPPFACGWYGENGLDYVRWLQNSWKDIV